MSAKTKIHWDHITDFMEQIIGNESLCWGENDIRVDGNKFSSGESSGNKLWTCKLFHCCYFEPLLQDRRWRTGRSVTGQIQLWFLLIETGASAGAAFWLVPPPETTLVHWTTAPGIRKADQCFGLFLLLTPSWIYHRLNLLDGHTDNGVYTIGFMREACQLLNLLMLEENQSPGIWCKCADVSECVCYWQ